MPAVLPAAGQASSSRRGRGLRLARYPDIHPHSHAFAPLAEGRAFVRSPTITSLNRGLSDPRAALEAGLSSTYAIERELGRGGMATVYLARDLKHGRPVALKVLRPALAVSMGPDRFRREITTAARLQHPHILSVHDSGETSGLLWHTMPFVRGESLKDRLRRDGRLPVDEALRITREAGRALDYAHREGVIHRDVKPENILLTLEGDTLVADFGIARALGENEHRLTQAGFALGTPAYMAPEQATGERGVDARTDQYSLAIVCYEMLVGRPPFEGPSGPAVIARRITSSMPSARAARGDVPESVDLALQRAMALDPAERFGSLADLVRALGGTGSPTPPGGVSVMHGFTPAEGVPAMSDVPGDLDSVATTPAMTAAQERRAERADTALRLKVVACVAAAVAAVAMLFAMR
jgi:serine/threonine protein kinase